MRINPSVEIVIVVRLAAAAASASLRPMDG